MFSLGMEVSYHGKCGIVDFIDDAYIVIKLPAASPKRSHARLIVYPEFYKKVEVLKDSGK